MICVIIPNIIGDSVVLLYHPARPKEPRIPRMLQLHDFQFFNTHRLSELYEKEVRYIMQAHQRKQVKDTIEVDEPESMFSSLEFYLSMLFPGLCLDQFLCTYMWETH